MAADGASIAFMVIDQLSMATVTAFEIIWQNYLDSLLILIVRLVYKIDGYDRNDPKQARHSQY